MKTQISYNYKLSSCTEGIGCLICDILRNIQAAYGSIDESTVFDIKVILNELFLNAVKHGNRFDENKLVDINVGISDDDFVYFIIQDQGEGYNYRLLLDEINNCCGIEDMLELKETGRGIMLVKNLCDNLKFNDRGNKVVVLKRLMR